MQHISIKLAEICALSQNRYMINIFCFTCNPLFKDHKWKHFAAFTLIFMPYGERKVLYFFVFCLNTKTEEYHGCSSPHQCLLSCTVGWIITLNMNIFMHLDWHFQFHAFRGVEMSSWLAVGVLINDILRIPKRPMTKLHGLPFSTNTKYRDKRPC